MRADANDGRFAFGNLRRRKRPDRGLNAAVPADPLDLVEVAEETRGEDVHGLAVEGLGRPFLHDAALRA